MTRLRITPDGEIVRPSLCEASMGLGLGLYLGSGGAAVASTPTGTPTALTIADATAIDTYWFMNGAAATVRYKGLATGGTADASKLTITVTRPGYDATGAATNYSVSVDGQVALRRAGSNATSKVQITAGSDVDIVYVPKRRIFASETCTAALLSSAYTSSLAGNPTVTNNSTLACPKPAVNVHAPPHRTVRADSASDDPRADLNSTRTGEIIVVSPHAQGGRPVACVKVRSVDQAYITSSGASGHATSWSTITSMSRSGYGTLNGLQADVFAYSIDVSALDHGDCFDEYEVYPWWGTSAAVFASVTNGDALLTTSIDRSANATTAGTINPANRIHFFYNKNNEQEIFANVDPQNVTGTASDAWGSAGIFTTQAAADSGAKPFLTIHAAAVALQAYNNSTYSRNDLGNCFISCMAGTYYGPGSAMSSRVYGSNWLVIRLHPSAGAGTAIFRSLQADDTTAVTTKDWGRRAWFRNIVWSGAQAAVSNSNNFLNAGVFNGKGVVFPVEQVHEGGSFTCTTSKAGITNLFRQNGFNWFIDVTFTQPVLAPNGNSVTSMGHFFGCALTGSGGTGGFVGNLVTGCDVLNAAISGDFQTGSGAAPNLETICTAARDVILTSNRGMWDNTITGSGVQLLEGAATSGISQPSNSYSWTHSQWSVHYTGGTTVKVMQFSADGQERSFAAPAWGLLGWNTHLGERTNVAYNQSPATAYAEKNFYIIGNALQNMNIKADTETTVDANRTGGAMPRHYVDGGYNAIISQANSGALADPGYDSWIGEVSPGNYKAASLGITTDTSRTGTGTNVLPDARPAVGSTMLDLIPVGSQPSKSYLGGAARDNSSTGPAGCREAA